MKACFLSLMGIFCLDFKLVLFFKLNRVNKGE